MKNYRLVTRFNGISNRAKLLGSTALVSCASAFPAFAIDETASDAVSTALTTGFQSMATTMLGTVTTALPIVLSVVGAVITVRFGIKFFRGLAK